MNRVNSRTPSQAQQERNKEATRITKLLIHNKMDLLPMRDLSQLKEHSNRQQAEQYSLFKKLK